MRLVIVYDNNSLFPDCRSSHGFSAFISYRDNNILFDTGWNGKILLENLEKLKINPAEIDIIFLSHQHWDHVGGLSILLEYTSNPLIVVPHSFSRRLKEEISRYGRIKEIKEKEEIIPGVYTTGELDSDIGLKEQSLALEIEKGKLLLITGCSHPDLEKIVATVEFFGNVEVIIGGFHGFTNLDFLKRFKLVIPCHCTVKKEEILEHPHISSKGCGIGLKLEFSERNPVDNT